MDKEISIKKEEVIKYLLFNSLGILMFFIPISLEKKSTIPLDHISNYIIGNFNYGVRIYVLILMLFGAFYPIFLNKDWNKNKSKFIFTIAKILGAVIGILYFFKLGPAFIFEKDMLPFLFEKLAIPLSVVIPLGGAFIIFLVGYGMLEFMGIIMEKVMRPIFHTPGKSSIDAVASFVGSYSIGLLITDKVYKEGKYSLKEAAIIATGFSTVSATFMIVVAKTLNIIDKWNFYFWSCLIITFLVTAITVRLFPLKNMSNSYHENNENKDEEVGGKTIVHRAWNAGIVSAQKNKEPVIKQFFKSYKDGIIITAGIVPSIMSIGLLGLLLAKYTPVFDYLGYIYLPFTYLLGFEDAILVSKSLATSIAEMFLPSMLVIKSDLLTRYVIAVVSVSEILFFSASIPCILSTSIKIKTSHLILIWIQRVILSLIFATIFGKLFL
ncbi:MAG: YjiH family protein [Fusobacteriaceae bacterium]